MINSEVCLKSWKRITFPAFISAMYKANAKKCVSMVKGATKVSCVLKKI